MRETRVRDTCHRWTNASVFQRSAEFFEICFDDCEAQSDDLYAPDSDGERCHAHRQAKRRKIERIAGSFLDGDPLVIPSARRCPQAVKDTIFWGQRTSTDPAFVFPVIRLYDTQNVWVDAENEDELLERLSRPAGQACHQAHGVLRRQSQRGENSLQGGPTPDHEPHAAHPSENQPTSSKWTAVNHLRQDRTSGRNASKLAEKNNGFEAATHSVAQAWTTGPPDVDSRSISMSEGQEIFNCSSKALAVFSTQTRGTKRALPDDSNSPRIRKWHGVCPPELESVQAPSTKSEATRLMCRLRRPQPSTKDNEHESALYEPSGADETRHTEIVNETRSSPTQDSAGTQTMPNRAQYNLIASPKNRVDNNAQTPGLGAWCARSKPGFAAHSERGNHSQKNHRSIGNTQALVDTFGGFSTVKKPRHGHHISTGPAKVSLDTSRRRWKNI